MLRLALPVLVEQLLHVLVAFVDTYLAGNYLPGDKYLAAIGLMSYVLWLIPSMFASVAIGATAMTSRFVGAKDYKSASRITNQAFLVGSLLAVLATVWIFFFGRWFVGALQLQQEAAPLAVRYLKILTPVIPAIMIEQVGIACLRGAGDTLSGLRAMAIVNLVNVCVSYCLATGVGPLPNLGWDGLAWGTACGHAVGASIILGFLLRGRAGLKLSWPQMKPHADLIRRLMRIGTPGGIDMMAVLFCHLWFLSIINRLGTVAAAAHGLGIRIESLAYLPGAAFQVAAATLVGQYLGAGDHRRAMRSAVISCLAGGGIMASAGVLFFVAAEPMAAFFLGESSQETAQLAASLLRVVALAMPSLAISMILTGALRGAGDTRWPLVITLVGFLVIRIPGAYLLAWDEVQLPLIGISINGFGLGVLGAWYAMVADIVLASFLVFFRFWQGSWKRMKI